MATAGMAGSADAQMNQINSSGLQGQSIGGLLLGAVWSPCIGPTLGGAIALASQGESLIYVTVIMGFFALGVSTIIIGLGMGAREAIRKRANALRNLAEKSKPILGVTFVAVGLMLYFKVHHIIDAWALEVMPIWLQDLSVVL
jgi:cytochrome c biogenesis protein CcdA|tara:strand:+ start:145 stop:573 length:429 start_codon:yes stop_codon:yes gene_type:complete